MLLVEAKAHLKEFCSSPCSAGAQSRARISEQLSFVAQRLNARDERACWCDVFYQYTNRLAHLFFLRERRRAAYLVMVNFLNDKDMQGPSSREVWDGAYRMARYALGLPDRHMLSHFELHVHPDVMLAADQEHLECMRSLG